MLTSILNLTSGKQQDSLDISGTSVTPHLQQNSNHGQTVPKNDFDHQLNQFRQLMQVLPTEHGKNLPSLNSAKHNLSESQLAEKLSQLQSMFSKLERMSNFSQEQVSTSASPFSSSELSESPNLQGLLDAITANLGELKAIHLQSEQGLTEHQTAKLSDAIEFIQQKLADFNLILADAENLSIDSAKIKQAIAELYADSSKAIQRVGQAINEAKTLSSSQNEQALINKSVISHNTLLHSKSSLYSTSLEQSSMISSEKTASGVASDLAKGETAKWMAKGEADLLNLAKGKLTSDNTEAKATPKFQIGESNLPQKAELEMLVGEKKRLQTEAIGKTSEGLLAISKNILNATTPSDIKHLQNQPLSVARTAEPGVGIVPTTTEVTSGQNPQATQITSHSNIQQGLSLRNDFSPNLALRIQWIFQQALSSAEIMMDPPELGPLSIKMQHRAGETNIMFQVNNQQTKEMIEENLPKLKELLQEQGIALGDTQVKQNQQQKEQQLAKDSLAVDGEELLENDESPVQNLVSADGRVAILDAYI